MIRLVASDYPDVPSLIKAIGENDLVTLDCGEKSYFILGKESSKQFIADRMLRRFQNNPGLLDEIKDALNDDIVS